MHPIRLGRYHCGLMPVFHTVDSTKDTELVYSHDAVNHAVSWNGVPGVNTVVGYTRFRFYMRNASLYSYRIADA